MHRVLKPGRGRAFLMLFTLLTAAVAAEERGEDLQEKDLMEMSLEELMQLEVTSAGRKSQHLADASAAVFVITADDIRRSGATSIPEALRMVPGLNVARINSSRWAISARGFSGRFANKLQVLIDGRSVYSPTFSGVYWEVQDTLLEDVERIEVIRGPSASLWGANAVNGVISIITKEAGATQGGHASFGGGTFEKRFGSFRYGAKLSENTSARAYVKGFSRGDWKTAEGQATGNSWDMLRGGVRVDHDLGGGSSLMVQGEHYDGDVDQSVALPRNAPPYFPDFRDRIKVAGTSILGRWKEVLDTRNEFIFQAFYDHTDRRERYGHEIRDTFELDFQHRLAVADIHDVVWGLSYRSTSPHFDLVFPLSANNENRTRDLVSGFVQDEIDLIPDRFKLTLGGKLEYNEYTGLEVQPTARWLFKYNSQHTVWGAVSRAVRTPSLLEDSGDLAFYSAAPGARLNPQPLFPLVIQAHGNGDYKAEVLWAYELGYRFNPSHRFSADLALFYNDYDRLRSFENPSISLDPNGFAVATFRAANRVRGQAYGAELHADWQALDHWRLQAGYTYLHMDLQTPANSEDISSQYIPGNDPSQQFSLRSSFNPVDSVDLDFWLRYVDRLTTAGSAPIGLVQKIPAYVTLDARAAWRPMRQLELSLVGQNLLDPHRPEYYQDFYAPSVAEAPRGVYFRVDWRF